MHRPLFLLFWALFISGVGAQPTFLVSCNQYATGTPAQESIVALMRAALDRVGYAMELFPCPPERSLRMADEGSADGELARSDEGMEAYKNIVLVPEPVNALRTWAYTRRAPNKGVSRERCARGSWWRSPTWNRRSPCCPPGRSPGPGHPGDQGRDFPELTQRQEVG